MRVEQPFVLVHRKSIRHASNVIRDGAKLPFSPEASPHVCRKKIRVLSIGSKKIPDDPLGLPSATDDVGVVIEIF